MNTEIDLQRDYWNKQSMDFKKIYTKEKSKFSILLDKIFRKDMFERFVYTIDNCKPVQDRIFLDVGCGSGLFSIELAKMGAKKVIGIDIAENMVEISKREAELNNVQDICEFIQSDLLEYTVKDEINVSFGIGLFDYIKDSYPVILKMYEVSKDKAIFAFPRFWTWRAPIRKIRLSLRGCPVYFYTRKKVENLLKKAGFSKIQIDKVGKLYCVVGSK